MDVFGYLETLPLDRIVKYQDHPPKGGVLFTGFTRQHPQEKNKLILVSDPLGAKPRILEFKIEDVLHAEEAPQAVMESGARESRLNDIPHLLYRYRGAVRPDYGYPVIYPVFPASLRPAVN